MATHSSVLAWEIPQTEEPDGLQGCKGQTRLYTHTQNIRGRELIEDKRGND